MKNPPDFPSHLPTLRTSSQVWQWVYRGRKYLTAHKIAAGHLAYIGDNGGFWTFNDVAERAEGGTFHYAELVEIPIPTPAEPDYNSLHYRAYVEAAFAGGLRMQRFFESVDEWEDCSPCNERWKTRINPQDADKEPDYSSKAYQRRVLLAAFDGVPCEYLGENGIRWQGFCDNRHVMAAMMGYSNVRIAPPIKPQLDPYADLKAAHAAGQVIEFLTPRSEVWTIPAEEIRWNWPVERYRIKPAPPRMVALEAGDIPPVCWLRYGEKDEHPVLVTSVHGDRVGFTTFAGNFNRWSLAELKEKGWLYSSDRKTWIKCEKEAK